MPVCSFPREMAPCFHSVVIKGYWTPKSYPTITPERLRQRETRQGSRRKEGRGRDPERGGQRCGAEIGWLGQRPKKKGTETQREGATERGAEAVRPPLLGSLRIFL